MKKIRVSLVIVITVCLALGFALSSCSGSKATGKVDDYVKCSIEALSKGQFDDEFVSLSGQSSETIQGNYDQSIKEDALYFCYYTGIIEELSAVKYMELPAETKTRIENLYTSIYNKSKFDVRDPEKEDDGSFSVEVTVNPIDIFSKAKAKIEAGEYQPYNDFVDKYNTGAIKESDFSSSLADVMIGLVEDSLKGADYKEAKTFVVKVTQSEDEESLSMDSNDLHEIKSSMIFYP